MDEVASRHSPEKGKKKAMGEKGNDKLFFLVNSFLLLLSIAGFIYSLAIPMGIALAVSLRMEYLL
ncbi:hypothetical protein SpiGrapes_0281 [Sphaerochaeta pleomorpha str. Grapes]|uniref:Uncharacterized protein n=1 Tax=Sphaerochaeta pleomorpha (strain ATCC BAA-1885 / DSM 22778 / Grapes) TaxID=158190 RepID=G8QUW5_SPHPG|nr:hypothetical protein [Sphaerochaeta pleomorpha]AEV28141.1 hypothetical protein SpiGrapes_0281 [Sphaerochaeta pleomorpha str. Grapes]